MTINHSLLLALVLALLVIGYLARTLLGARRQLGIIKEALQDIKDGNLNRRVLASESDMTKQICYGINEIASSSQARLVRQKQAEQAYKRLMTSLSHDVKTPLASLVGYLEAVENGLVTGPEKDEYIHVAVEKAHRLKLFVTSLFEWVKLDAGEQVYHFDVFDLNEITRNSIAEWVPMLEAAGVALDSQGRIKAGVESRYRYQTSQEKIFAGGDAVRGADLVVTAMAEGRHAAQGILDYLARKTTPLH